MSSCAKEVKEEIELKENAVTTMKEMFQDKISKLENEKNAFEERISKLEQTITDKIQTNSSAPAPKSDSKKPLPDDKPPSIQTPASELHVACSISPLSKDLDPGSLLPPLPPLGRNPDWKIFSENLRMMLLAMSRMMEKLKIEIDHAGECKKKNRDPIAESSPTRVEP